MSGSIDQIDGVVHFESKSKRSCQRISPVLTFRSLGLRGRFMSLTQRSSPQIREKRCVTTLKTVGKETKQQSADHKILLENNLNCTQTVNKDVKSQHFTLLKSFSSALGEEDPVFHKIQCSRPGRVYPLSGCGNIVIHRICQNRAHRPVFTKASPRFAKRFNSGKDFVVMMSTNWLFPIRQPEKMADISRRHPSLVSPRNDV